MAKSKRSNAKKTSGKHQRPAPQSDLSKVSTRELLNGGSISGSVEGEPRKNEPGKGQPLEGDALIKETCRRLRAAKGLWDAHRNAACRNEREKALSLYNRLSKAQKEKIPQQLRIWLRYRSEKYFGAHQTPLGHSKRSGKKRANKPSVKPSSKIFKKGQLPP